MKAARLYGNKDIRVEDIELREIGENEVIIEVEWCGICGSDLHEYLAGPITSKELPVVLGHEISGVVAQVGKNVTHVKPGDKVVSEPLLPCMECPNCQNRLYQICEKFALLGFNENGGFAEYTIVNKKFVHKIPDDMPLDKAALVEPFAVVLHAVRQSQFKPGDAVAVFGAGPIGLLLTSMLRASGASQIFVVEISEARRKQAEKYGATKTINPITEDAVEIIKSKTKGGVNVAYEVAGVQETYENALRSVKGRGEMLVISLFEKPITYMPNEQLWKEAKINVSSCYSTEVFPQVIKMLEHDLLNLDGMVTKKIHIDDIVEEGFECFLNDSNQYKILVTPKVKNLG